MAAEIQPTHHHSTTLSRTESNLQKSKVYNIDVVVEAKVSSPPPPSSDDEKDYTQRAQWLRAAVLGANDGLLSTASLMMGVGAVRKDVKTMILTGIAGLVAGACSMAIGEFVSVYSQYDTELAQMKRQGNITQKDKLPNPYYAAFASAIAFAIGAGVPLLGAAFVNDYKVRLGVVVAVVSLALIVFGGLSAVLGKAPLVKSVLRVLIGGWLAMAVTFGLTKLVDHAVI